jgi:hypothetical protein
MVITGKSFESTRSQERIRLIGTSHKNKRGGEEEESGFRKIFHGVLKAIWEFIKPYLLRFRSLKRKGSHILSNAFILLDPCQKPLILQRAK